MWALNHDHVASDAIHYAPCFERDARFFGLPQNSGSWVPPATVVAEVRPCWVVDMEDDEVGRCRLCYRRRLPLLVQTSGEKALSGVSSTTRGWSGTSSVKDAIGPEYRAVAEGEFVGR